jgi:hypothetical protein
MRRLLTGWFFYWPHAVLAITFIAIAILWRHDLALVGFAILGLLGEIVVVYSWHIQKDTERTLREHLTAVRGENVLLRAELNRQKRIGLQGNGHRWQ